jgi:hypothetical protein
VVRPGLSLLLALAGAVFLAGCGDSTVQSSASPTTVGQQPPAWLAKKIDVKRSELGYPSAEAWWAKTEAGKLDGLFESPYRPKAKLVYLIALHGDFTNWGVDGPAASPSPLPTWAWVTYDASLSEDAYTAGHDPYWPEGVSMIPVTATP